VVFGEAASGLLLHAEVIERHLPGQVVLVTGEHQVDALANVLGHGDLRSLVELLQLVRLLRRDVDGGRDLLPGHGALRKYVTIDIVSNNVPALVRRWAAVVTIGIAACATSRPPSPAREPRAEPVLTPSV